LELEEARPEELSGLAARFQAEAAVDAGSGVSRATVEIVSGSYFNVLGAEAAIGRTLQPQDDEERDAEPWVVLTHDYWRDRLGEDPAIVGKAVRVNGFPMTVVGVTKPGFHGFNKLRRADLFTNFQMNGVVIPTYDLRERRNAIWLNIFGRVAPGADPQQAIAALKVAYGGVLRRDLAAHERDAERREKYVRNTLEFVDGSQGLQFIQQFVTAPLQMLAAMVGLLLLITCLNVANLLVIRAAKREKEVALRSSLGATRSAVIRLVLMESALLAAGGAALGLPVARLGSEAFVQMIPASQYGLYFDGSMNLRVLMFSVALAGLVALLFGLMPALQSTRSAAATALKSEATSVSLSRAQTRTRQMLIVAQVSLSLALLAAAGLFGKSLSSMFDVNPGFAVEQLLAFSINPAEHGYEPAQTHRLAVDLQQRLALAPGVEAVSAAASPVLAGAGGQNTIAAEGYERSSGEDMQAGANRVLPGFFSTVGVGLLAGREFTENDAQGAPEVVIVNEAFADRFFGSAQEAIGRRVGFDLERQHLPFEVVGVVADHRAKDLREDAFPRTYWPLLQAEKPDHMAFYLRTRGSPGNSLAAAIGAVRELDPDLAVFNAKTVDRQVEETHFIERLFARLSAAFAVTATLIAAIGLYGVGAFSVARRTREIGVRMALGAVKSGVFGMVLREALVLAATGIVIGIPLAVGVGKLVESQLYGVSAIDFGVTSAAVVALLAAATLAGYLPARRAMRISPIEALRHE
jgi:predicted permease